MGTSLFFEGGRPIQNHRECLISSDKKLLDIDWIHRFLHDQSYWARGISKDTVRKSAPCYGLYQSREDGIRQVGFARVITDLSTFAYLADVFIIKKYRNRGWGRTLLTQIIQHENLQKVRRIMLATADAHALYEELGFTTTEESKEFMQKKIEHSC